LSILNPEHLLDQARKLIAPPPAGPPRQVDLRRAVSAAYYSVFHATLTAAADEFIGKAARSTPQYALVYRSIEHASLRTLCIEATQLKPSPKYVRYVPPAGFGPDIQLYGIAALELQERRHAADYDPSIRLRTADAVLAVNTARTALERFAKAAADRRKAFLALLLFRPR
jgi:hypothetical protein